MEQRRLRLGDIVDDYCPRERRVTNHAVVAMVEEDVKQTRCGTCDAEHPYKGGQAPRRRKKETTGALYKEVLAGITDGEAAPVLAGPAATLASQSAADEHDAPDADVDADADAGEGVAEELDDLAVDAVPPAEEGPVHRQLIRATLPRIEGHKEERRPTDFTIRQPGAGRPNNNFRGDHRTRPRGGQGQGQGQGQSQGQGHRQAGGASRFAGSRANGTQGRGGSGRGQGGGFRTAPPQGQGRSGGGRKRSR